MKIEFLKLLVLALSFFVATTAGSSQRNDGDFRDIIPSADSWAEVTRICVILNYASSVSSAAFTFSPKPLTPLFWLNTPLGLNAAIVASETTSTLYVAFRGIDAKTDDLDFGASIRLDLIPYKFPNSPEMNDAGKVHKGFYRTVFDKEEGVYKDLDLALRNATNHYPDFQVKIVGYDLGACQSILYASYVAKQLFPDKKVYSQTFSTPRVGDEDFKQWIEGIDNLAIWRMVYRDDIITRIPLKIMNYRHVGHLLWFRDSDKDLLAYYLQDGSKEKGYAGVPWHAWYPDFFDLDWDHIHDLSEIVQKFGMWQAALMAPLVHHFWYHYERSIDIANKTQDGWPKRFELEGHAHFELEGHAHKSSPSSSPSMAAASGIGILATIMFITYKRRNTRTAENIDAEEAETGPTSKMDGTNVGFQEMKE